MKHRLWIIPSLLSLLSPALVAERIDLNRALDLAERNHPRLQAGAARITGASAQVLAARAYPNPELAALTGQVYSPQPGGPRFNIPVVTLSQPLEIGALRPARTELARRGVESSQRAFDEVRLSILGRVRLAYYEVLRRNGEIAIADEALKFAQEFRDRLRVRVEVGEAGRLELIRAEAEVATARTLAANIRIRRAADLSAFRAAVGGESALDIEPAADPLPDPPALPPLDALKDEVVRRHPALAYLQAEVRRAQADVQYQKALKRPQPEFRFELDNSNPSYRAGIALTLPAWNRRLGQIAFAEANASEARYLSSARRVELL